MSERLTLKPHFIVTETGERVGVQLSMVEWEAIQRILGLGGEAGSEDILKSLEADGISLDDLRVCR